MAMSSVTRTLWLPSILVLVSLLVLSSLLSLSLTAPGPTSAGHAPRTVPSVGPASAPSNPSGRAADRPLPDNDPTGPGVEIANFSVGEEPSQAVYDPVNGYLYLANSGSDNVSIINGSDNQVIASVSVGLQPRTPVVDPLTDQVFVPNYASANVTVISGATGTVVANVAVGSNPYPGADDGMDGFVYIPNYGSGNVTVINASTDKVTADIPVGGNPSTPAFDSSNDTMFLSYSGDAVLVISCSTNTVVKKIVQSGQLLNDPAPPAFDPANGDVYVPSEFGFVGGGDPVTVINGTSYRIVATLWVGGYPSVPAYDPVNGELYVSNYYPGTGDNVTAISGTSNTIVANIPVGVEPLEAAIDTANGNAFVANYGSDNLSVISGATNSVVANVNITYGAGHAVAPSTPAFDPANYELLVSGVWGGHGAVAVFSTPPPPVYPVTFTESGLPSGATWSVTVNGGTGSSTTPSVGFSIPNGTYAYTVATEEPGWTVSSVVPPSPLVVDGSAVSVAVTFSLLTYPVTFTTDPASCGSITFNGTEYTNGEEAGAAAGSYALSAQACTGYTLATLAGSGSVAVSSGTATVSGAGGIVATFSPVEYSVTMTTIPGACGSVTFNGTTYTDGQSVQATVGSYAVSAQACAGYTLASLAGSGGVAVSSGTATVTGAGGLTATFVPVEFSVTFTTSPAACGSITFNGTAYSNGGSVEVAAGSYAVSAQPCAGDTLVSLEGSGSVSVSSGIATVSGPGGVTATFAPIEYTVTFTESGLPSGTSWSVTLEDAALSYDVTASTAGTAITFTGLLNGTYSFTVSPVRGYSAVPSAGSLVLEGCGAYCGQVIVFSPSSTCNYNFTITFNETGLPVGATWSITLKGVWISPTSVSATVKAKGGGRTITFVVPCESYDWNYTFTVSAPARYTATPSSGLLGVAPSNPPGTEAYQTVAFAVTGCGILPTLTSPNAEAGGLFGQAVAVSGTTVVVGAEYETASGYTDAGRAYVCNARTGRLISTLTSPNAQVGGFFGYSVAVSGTTVVVGAPEETATGSRESGHAYVFRASTGAPIATLTSPNSQTDGFFGLSVAISGSTVVVGAYGETALGYSDVGHAYVFKATTGALISTLMSPSAQAYGEFGSSVAISGSTVVVGAPDQTTSGHPYAGHAYVFRATTGAPIATLTSPNAQTVGLFGASVAVSGTTVVVGAPGENVSGHLAAGRAYIFKATTGALIATLASPDAQRNGGFGTSVAVGGTTVVVGAPGENASEYVSAGHAYVFKATTGALITTLTSPNAQTNGEFGVSVAVSGTTVVVGARFETASGYLYAGHAYIFKA